MVILIDGDVTFDLFEVHIIRTSESGFVHISESGIKVSIFVHFLTQEDLTVMLY